MSTYSGGVPWDRGNQDTRDTGQRIAQLPVGTPDWTQFPYHPPGSWERALVYLAAGYRPTDEDMDALHTWNGLSNRQQQDYLNRAREFRLAVLEAAVQPLQDNSPLTLDELVSAVSDSTQLGSPQDLASVFRAILTMNMAPNPEDTNGLTTRVKHIYLDHRYTVQGHYYAIRKKDLVTFARQHLKAHNNQS